ncbi:HEAT repeat domain-containing protein [Crocosphaera sp.]|uniref:HEAT repeat domain-containing protein n=1 Tax=Crocosphaera sp. TaxID=2729996 RepID=UPI003F1EE8A4|nr:HEAT repeat domain-containing protein [Crocosphaera sp.]
MSQTNLPATKKKSSPFSIDWNQVGRIMLKYALPINPMSTQPDDQGNKGKDLLIRLDRIQSASQNNAASKDWPIKSSLVKSLTSQGLPLHNYQLDALFQQICARDRESQHRRSIAIIGDSGTGKSLCLQTLAHWMLDRTDYIPIWVSPEQLKTLTLTNYLSHQWLTQCSKHYGTEPRLSQDVWQASFEALLKSGRIWLLGDGLDYLFPQSISDGHLSPLDLFVQQQRNLGNCHLILSCQTVTWKSQPLRLAQFDIYQTKSLSSSTQIQQFVQQWLHPYSPQKENLEVEYNLGEQLSSWLPQPQNQHLQKWLKNPLRLSLFCRLWQKNPQTLPQTAATLYRHLVDEFHQWQLENIHIRTTEQAPLNEFLTSLAFHHRQTAETSVPITQGMIVDNQSLLSLSLQLHWLRPVGIVTQDHKQRQYRFQDQTFEDYFAALAIDNWQDFFAQETNALKMFSEQWQQILLFWVGREDIASEDKEALIQALVSFQEEWDQENFYGFRAYLTAAMALSQFRDCSLAQTIVKQLLSWALADKDGSDLRRLAAREVINYVDRPLVMTHLIHLIKNNLDQSQPPPGLDYLERLGQGNKEVIVALTECLHKTEDKTLAWQLAETLGTIDPGNATAIGLIVQALETATSEPEYQKAFVALEKIAHGQGQGVKALVRLLHHQLTPNLRRRTFQCLESVGRGNATAIAILVQLIRTTKDGTTRRQAAESLEKIDPGNPTAIAGLIKLMDTETTQSIHQEVVYSLGEVCPGNQQAIAALVALLEETQDLYVRWIAISSLGKIGFGNEPAIAILEKLIEPGHPLLIRKEAFDSLGKIDPSNPKIVQASMQLMEEVEDEEIYREIAEKLGKIDPGNPKAINALTKSLQVSTDEFVLRQVAVSLGKIDPGNLEALRVLVNLIQSTDDPDIRSLAAESLGEIGSGNPAAIATLIRLLETSSHLESRRCAAKSLSKIATGHKGAIAAFMKVLPTIQDQDLGKQIADGLIHILPEKQMPQVVSQLRDHLLEESSPQPSPSYLVMWHCAQHLSYQTFREAWHQRHLQGEVSPSAVTPDPETRKPLTPVQQLQQELENSSELGFPQIIGIDSGRFIDPDHPAIDIYDQMLAQDCPPFEHGLPETLSKLRLYWHLLQKNSPRSPLLLLFYDRADCPLSSHLLKSLAKFNGLIAVITKQESLGLSVFSPDDPQLSQTLLSWLKSHLQ